MKKILVVVSVYRQGERMHPIIPSLAKQCNLDLLCVHQMSERIHWNGTIDMRKRFHETYDSCFDQIYKNWRQIDYSKYDAIVLDDCRDKGEEIPYKLIYKQAKKYNVTVFAASHGNGSYVGHIYEVDHYKSVFDYCFLFGKWHKQLLSTKVSDDIFLLGGIPSNDMLSNYKKDRANEYILIITNFLANERKVFPTIFSNQFVKDINLKGIQDKYQKPVVVKIKNRDRHFAIGNPYQQDINFVQSILNKNNITGHVIRDVDDDNLLIAKAHSVIGMPSTMCFKPIQLGIPTVTVEGGAHTGAYKNFSGHCETKQVPDVLERQVNIERDLEFIKDNIEGGIDYNSTKSFVDNIINIINENN